MNFILALVRVTSQIASNVNAWNKAFTFKLKAFEKFVINTMYIRVELNVCAIKVKHQKRRVFGTVQSPFASKQWLYVIKGIK